MTHDEAIAKRHELLATARKAELAGDEALATRCRTLATNCGLIAFGDPETQARGELWYGRNKADMEKYLAERETPDDNPCHSPQDATCPSCGLGMRSEDRAV